MPYIKQVLIALDQLCNTLFFGWADETFSSRCYRWKRRGFCSWPARIIDTIFFWDKEGDAKHCELSYRSEEERRHLPPEFRV